MDIRRYFPGEARTFPFPALARGPGCKGPPAERTSRASSGHRHQERGHDLMDLVPGPISRPLVENSITPSARPENHGATSATGTPSDHIQNRIHHFPCVHLVRTARLSLRLHHQRSNQGPLFVGEVSGIRFPLHHPSSFFRSRSVSISFHTHPIAEGMMLLFLSKENIQAQNYRICHVYVE